MATVVELNLKLWKQKADPHPPLERCELAGAMEQKKKRWCGSWPGQVNTEGEREQANEQNVHMNHTYIHVYTKA